MNNNNLVASSDTKHLNGRDNVNTGLENAPEMDVLEEYDKILGSMSSKGLENLDKKEKKIGKKTIREVKFGSMDEKTENDSKRGVQFNPSEDELSLDSSEAF